MERERFKARQKKMREAMKENGLDALIIYAGKQWGAHGWRDFPIRYLTGYDVAGPHALLLFSTSGESLLLIREKWDLARAKTVGVVDKVTLSTQLAERLCNWVDEQQLKKGKLGIICPGSNLRGVDLLPVFLAEPLGSSFKGRSVLAQHLLEDIMTIRDEYEIRMLRESAKIADVCTEKLFRVAKCGVTEQDLFTEIFYTAQKMGAENIHISVTTGFPNYWNHPPTDRALQEGDFLMMEISPRFEGYMTQVVRMGVVGDISREYRDLFQVIYRALNAAISATQAGTPIKNVFAAAQQVVAESVCGILDPTVDIGHGCAMDLNGTPLITAQAEKTLRQGMTLVIHPIVFFPYIGTSFMLGEYLVVQDGAPEVITTPQESLISII